jgi:peptidoglycan-associated lipoprotein
MRKIFTPLFSISLFFSLTASTCKKVSMEEGNKAFQKKEFFEAANIYSEVARKEKNKKIRKEALYQQGLSNLMSNDYKSAEKAFAKAQTYKTNSDQAYFFESVKGQADALKMLEKYAEAIGKYNQYLAEFPNDKEVKTSKEGCELALKWKDQKTRYVIENFKKVNTRESDFAPFFLDKEGLVFTSARQGGANKRPYEWTGQYFDDLWIAKMKKRRGEVSFDNPELLQGSVNTKFSDGVSSFAEKGRLMYYTQCNSEDGKGLRCKIYSAKKVGKDAFEQPFLLDFNSDSFSCVHPAISPDGKQLFFSSNMPGGYGGWDLYVVNYIKRGNTWSVPLNLGPVINSEKDEMYPYVHTDGTLYFASNGLLGLGGLDIFHTTGGGQDWSAPENMKSPVNSGGDDFGIWLAEDKESGYFTSNREGGRGSDDIYSFTMKPCELFLTGVVRDEITKAVIKDAIVHIRSSLDTGLITITTDATGSYRIPMTRNTKYELMAKGPEYDYYYDSPTEYESSEGVECFTTITRDFELKKLQVVFTVEGILYDLDMANIRPDAAQILDDSVVSVLKRFPRIRIELGSHTDCRASHAYNDTLSQKRADSAVAYIVSKGIDPERIVAKGYGERDLRIKKCACDLTDPGNRICTEAEHQLNRRTTVKVIDYNWTPAVKEPEKKKEEEAKPAPNNRRTPPQRTPPQRTPPKRTPPKR